MARYDTPEFITQLNLDPNQWHAIGEPTPKQDAQGIPTPGVYTIVLAGPGGATRIVTMAPVGPGVQSARPPVRKPDGTVVTPGVEGGTLAPNVLLSQVDWSITDQSEAIKPPTESAQETNAQILKAQQDALAAQTLAAQRDQQLKDLQKDNAQRDANKASTGYAVTDVERATIENNARQAGLTQQQIDNQLKVASDNNQVSRASNEIAATNAATNAFSAQRNAEAQLAQTLHIQRGDDESAAKFEREKADRDIANRIAQDKLKLEQLQQSQANLIAQGQLGATQQANVLRGQELEQRTAEAKQTAETAAIGQGAQAAASTLGTERQFQSQAAQTGGNLLQNRAQTFQNLSQAPFAQAASLSQGSAGRYGMLGGGLHSVPEGAVQNIMQGAMGVSTGLYGGQSALQAAAQAIEGIRPGASMTPMGQAAAAIITQIQERAQQLMGGGKVNAPATAGPSAATPAAATAAATPAAVPVQAPVTALGQGVQPTLGISPTAGATQALGDPYGRLSAMTAPTTQPTININFSGGGAGGMRVM